MSNTDPKIAALEYVVTILLAQSYAGLSVDQVATIRRLTRARLEEQVLAKTPDPAMSDHLSAELVDAVDRLFVVAARVHLESQASRSP